jgi:hypothetical protein
MTVTVMMKLMMMVKMGDGVLSESMRIFINDYVCVYVEMYRPKKDLMNEQCKRVYNEVLCDLYRQPNIVGVVK